MAQMPPDLEVLVANFTPFQRTYAEYRAKGLKQAEASKRAGSNGSDKQALGRIGYQAEQIPGVKEYILWLQQMRAQVAMIDQAEIIDKLRTVYREALATGKFKDANDTTRMLGQMIGLFGNGTTISVKDDVALDQANAFKEEDESMNETSKRMDKLQQMLKDINKG